ncbi:hypothetical protein [Mannheimia massilioguelmaensis]|uniref:hypothetical protein n=1 Tax=Mannheimia massilioguelmaensis TaxID=1604354 RepID=UPI0005CA2AB6|nr:hypothetical protein [Mannheimia massilioguelmaensis]
MKNSDFIQMNQCAIYSIKFPTDKFVETLESAICDERGDGFSAEVIANPLTGKKVHILEHGYFFTLRVNYKKITKALLSAKVFELKSSEDTKHECATEKEWEQLATVHLFATVPASTETMNVFYSPEKELLIANKNSKNCRTALSYLIEQFGLAGFRSVVVSDEKFGLTTRLKNYLNDYSPMFKHLQFENEATLFKRQGFDETHLVCRHLDEEEKRIKAKEALNDEYSVQSVLMRFDNRTNFMVKFKLDKSLKIRTMKFAEYNDVARQLNNSKTATKSAVMYEYLNQQLDMLLKTAESTVLEFVDGTKLEGFV